MGNKVNFAQIRTDVIQKRNAQLEKYVLKLSKIVQNSQINEQKVNQIINADLVHLVKLLNLREVTSLQLIAIFGIRAATIEDNFQFAVEKAQQCDEIRQKSGKRNWTMEDDKDEEKFLPPLFGVPISFKDNLQLAGTRATIGLTIRANKVDLEDGPIAKCFKNSGMIPFIKTNLPQLAFNFDSNNFLWGRCLNPWKLSKSVGGSSGGQAAAIAARISPIGAANDMGGSIRIPVHFCGVSGLMPSPYRVIILEGMTHYSQAFSGKDFIKGGNGPVGNSIDSLALWMDVATTQSFYAGSHDPYIKHIPFNFKLYKQIQNSKKILKIGYINHLQIVECTPACSRAVMETVEHLKKEGHHVFQIEFPNLRQLIKGFFGQIGGQGKMRGLQDMLEGEALAPEYKKFDMITKVNSYLRKAIRLLLKIRKPRMSFLVQASQQLTAYQYMKLTGRSYKIRQDWINYWRKHQLDFVLCPGFGSEASNHGQSNEAPILAVYTFMWNMLAMSVCSMPVTVVREDEQHYESRWNDDITDAIVNSSRDSAGLPVNIQVVGLPFQEEKVLGFSKRLETHFEFYKKHPLPEVAL